MATKNTNLSFFKKEDVPNAKGLSFGIVVSEWNANISSSLEINGGAYSIDLFQGVDLNGTVTNSGDFTAIIGTGSQGINFIGQLSGNSGSGTWISSTDSSTGTWEGYNYNQ
jgi:hypothetical protein